MADVEVQNFTNAISTSCTLQVLANQRAAPLTGIEVIDCLVRDFIC